MERTKLPAKQEPVITDTEEVYATLQSMESHIVRATDMVKQINARLVPLRDELIKMDVNGIEELCALFAANRLHTIDKLLKP